MPISILFAPFRDGFSGTVAALERSDNVVSRPATLSLRSSAATPSVAALSHAAWYRFSSRRGVRLVERFLTLALLTLGLRAAESPAGILAGRVLNVENGSAVTGAIVGVVGATLSVTTDLEGSYRLVGVPVGFHTLTVSRDGFLPSSVSGVAVMAGLVANVDVPLNPTSSAVVRMEAFSVSAEVVQNSGLGLLSMRQKSIAVSDAIGSEQMSKLGFGTAAAAMKAVTGASVVGGKYV
jgi:hypothetical protein